MKLRIKENYLNEDIEAVKKYYPNIDDSTFMQLISLDPTYRDGSNSVGKYGKWILNLFKKGAISEEDFSEITPLLQQFTTYRNRVQNKDLNAYKTLDDLSNTLAQVVDDDSMLSDRQKLRFLKNVKAGRVSTDAEDDYDVVLDTSNFTVYVPNTHEASMKLGNGTEWCTAHENPEWYEKYTKNGGKLYIVKNKSTGERWQYSDDQGDFLDQDDEEFDILELMCQDERLSKFFQQFLGVDYYNFDGTYTYKGGKVPEYIKDKLETVVIDDGIECVDSSAFAGCSYLKKAVFSNSVEMINTWAFQNCSSLTTITLPTSLRVVGGNAFHQSGLVSIVIPDGVRKINQGAFAHCKELKRVEIADSVKTIGTGVFSDCDNLISVKLPNNIETIPMHMFSSCYHLNDVVIPESVRGINVASFFDCASLEHIELPYNVEFIGRRAFCGCRALKSVDIPNSVVAILEGAFEDCVNLKSIKIPSSVESMETEIFNGCKNITVYTDDEYVIDCCDLEKVPVKPIKEFKVESVNRAIKLHIKEDTACVVSKTSYMEDGLDKNGIYYFGQKPETPKSWRDIFKTRNLTDKESEIYDEWLHAESEHTGENIFDMIDNHINKKKGMCEMKLIRENDNEIVDYIELDSKQVKDADGWLTDYTMYMKIETTRDKWLAFLQSANPENPEVPEDMCRGPKSLTTQARCASRASRYTTFSKHQSSWPKAARSTNTR